MNNEQPPWSLKQRVLVFLIVIIWVVLALDTILAPHGSNGAARQSAAKMTSQTIALALQQYSLDHNGNYPEGKTSTEVFQQLMDGNYVADPSLFYLWMPGKVRPQSNQLKAENVCWDVTCCIDSSAPDGLPVVFLTGYKTTYQPGSRALHLEQEPPPPPRTWYEWWYGTPFWKRPFIAVCYKNNSAVWILADPDGSIPNFIPADFDPKGKTYRQLTP